MTNSYFELFKLHRKTYRCVLMFPKSQERLFYFENNHPDVIIFVSGITVCRTRVGGKAVSPCL